MKDLRLAVDQIIEELAFAEGEFAQRMAFLELGVEDIAFLQELHELLGAGADDMADEFYNFIQQAPALQHLLKDATSVERLKRAQAEYFRSLTAGEYGNRYLRDRLSVGIVHHRIGLDPKWYIGAYRKYFQAAIRRAREALGAEHERVAPMADALLKIVCLDMGLALDTYFAASRREIVRHKEYAEQLLARLPIGLVVVDQDLQVCMTNHSMRELCGLRLDGPERDFVGMSLGALISDAALIKSAEEVARTGIAARREIVIGASAMRHLRIDLSPWALENRSYVLLMVQDVTESVIARANLYESEERFRLTFTHAGVGLAHLAMDGEIRRANPKLLQILGYEKRELIGIPHESLMHPDDIEEGRRIRERLLANAIPAYAREKRYRTKNGRYVWVHATVSLVRSEYDEPRYFIAVIEDISARKQAAAQLIRLANYDALTELPNRLLLRDRLEQALCHASRNQACVAVLFLDVDRFKDVNDSLGHEAGDAMLKQIGGRLRRQVRAGDTVARLGGDEFVVLLRDITREEEAALVAGKILSALSSPVVVKEHEFYPTGSIGISMYPKDGGDVDLLLKNADTAMYQAKASGRNNFQFYTQAMNERVVARLKLERGLRRALDRNEFLLYYQPQVDGKTGTLIGAEALLRWAPREGSLVPPADFIPVAEETGQIVQIGRWVLYEACRQIRQWNDAGYQDLHLSVNLSARQFQQDIAAHVTQALSASGCSPACLTLELTESALMDDPGRAAATLRELKSMGVRLAIDDFGKGYSSLSYLSKFPIDILKIDASFVRNVSTSTESIAIVRAVIALAKAMSMSVVAEGIETVEQQRILEREQVDGMQGYYFGMPASATQFEQRSLACTPMRAVN